MKACKAIIERITPCFELKVMLELRPDLWQGQTMAFRGLDLPGRRSKKGLALRRHLTRVVGSVPFLAVKMHEKGAALCRGADFYYLAGEEDPARVAGSGRCLNEELLDLGLAEVYDENKRKIDFSERSIRVYDQNIDLVTGNFKTEVCMYINDCKQYLRAAIEGRPVDMTAEEFNPTDEEFLIIYGLKEVKEMCASLSGKIHLDWKGN